MNTKNALFQDYKRYENKLPKIRNILLLSLIHSGFRAVVLYRFGFYLRKIKLRYMAVVVEKIMHHLCNCWISTKSIIGEGFLIAHVGCIVIGGDTIIGKFCDIRQNTTFGGNYSKTINGRTKPIVGDYVSIGAGAVIIGPIEIGSNSIIGANSVVTRDVSPNTIVSGVPAEFVKKKWDPSTGRKL
jgi:serine O-acetyltransferase